MTPKVQLPLSDPRSAYATAAEAMQLLNVRQQTLYAYVSRGWIRSIPQQGKKARLYLRDDISRVGSRSAARAGHGAAAASAMNWGEPIFPTSITEITSQGPRYRNYLAADLVREGHSFEAVAELLWRGAFIRLQLGQWWHLAKSCCTWLKCCPRCRPAKTSSNASL